MSLQKELEELSLILKNNLLSEQINKDVPKTLFLL